MGATMNISDYDIIGDLEEKRVPKEDIVLAFLSPRMWAMLLLK